MAYYLLGELILTQQAKPRNGSGVLNFHHKMTLVWTDRFVLPLAPLLDYEWRRSLGTKTDQETCRTASVSPSHIAQINKQTNNILWYYAIYLPLSPSEQSWKNVRARSEVPRASRSLNPPLRKSNEERGREELRACTVHGQIDDCSVELQSDPDQVPIWVYNCTLGILLPSLVVVVYINQLS